MNILKMKLIIAFTFEIKRIECLRINLTKQLQDLHIENYKILLKEMKRRPK